MGVGGGSAAGSSVVAFGVLAGLRGVDPVDPERGRLRLMNRRWHGIYEIQFTTGQQIMKTNL